jgi:hypothetical protein
MAKTATAHALTRTARVKKIWVTTRASTVKTTTAAAM